MAYKDFISNSMIYFTALSLILFLLFLFQMFNKSKNSQSKDKHHPVAGSVIHYILNFNRLHDFLTELAGKYKTFRVLDPFRNATVFTADPLNVEYILKTNFKNYGRGEYNYSILRDLAGDSIFTVDGEKWLQQRKIASHEFSSKMLKDYGFVIFKKNATKLARVVSEAAKSNRSIDMQDLFMKSTLDSILEIACGVESDILNGSNEEGIKFSKAFDDASESILWRYANQFWKIKKFLNIGSEASLKRSTKVMDDFVYKLINNKIEQMNNLEDDFSEKNDKMISRLIHIAGNNSTNLRDMVLTLILAAKDTTATALSWFIYVLSKNPVVQVKVAEEVRKVLNIEDTTSFTDFANNINKETLEKMNYLHAAITETLRIYPTVPLIPRVCFSDDVWPDGFTVRKGDVVVNSSYAMGRMKFIWGDDAEEYKPERWLNKDGLFQRENPFKFTAFQAGPRICVGKEFAYMQMKIFSAVLLGSFIFKLSEKNETVGYKTMITLHINHGLHVCAIPKMFPKYK